MSIARTAVSAASLNGILFSIGGECALAELQDETLYLQCVEAYNPIMMEWSQRAEMQVARSFVAAVAVAGQLYALGKFPFHQVHHLSSNVQSICSKGFCFYILCSMRKLHWQISSHFVNSNQNFTCLGSKCFSLHDLTRFQSFRQEYVVEDCEKDEFIVFGRRNSMNLMLWEHYSARKTCV